jgi:hypothetical protein
VKCGRGGGAEDGCRGDKEQGADDCEGLMHFQLRWMWNDSEGSDWGRAS